MYRDDFMFDFKSFSIYAMLGFITIISIILSGDQNFREYVSKGLLPSFTNSTYTEFGNYVKLLNSSHCLEKVKNAGADIDILISSNYYRIEYKLPNMTNIIEVDNLKLKNIIKTFNLSCEKIENENGWIVRAKNKYGSIEFGFINGAYYENVDGMVNKLNWWNLGKVCEGMFKIQERVISEIINISSCFNRERIL